MPGTNYDAFWLYDGFTTACTLLISSINELGVSCSAHPRGADRSPGCNFDCFDVQEGDLAPDPH